MSAFTVPSGFTEDRRLCAPKDLAPLNRGHIIEPVADLRPKPDLREQLDSQLIYGERVMTYAHHEGFSLVQSERDGYVGWISAHTVIALADNSPKPTHQVRTLGSFIYPQVELKAPALMQLPLGARVQVSGEQEKRGTRYAITSHGAMIASHLAPLDEHESDFVAVAEKMIGIPYLWAGNSSFALDCSAFVQIAMARAGMSVLRDSDMQAKTIGEELSLDQINNLQRGDLVFWPGHVGIMQDAERLIHANGHTMNVASEPLSEAIERISYLYDKPSALRRPNGLSID